MNILISSILTDKPQNKELMKEFKKCYVIHEENSKDKDDFSGKNNHFHEKTEMEQQNMIDSYYDIKNEETEDAGIDFMEENRFHEKTDVYDINNEDPEENRFHEKTDIYSIKSEEPETEDTDDDDDDPLDPEIEPLFQCRICEEYFPDPNELEAHKTLDCLPCDFCDMVFGSEEWLTNHHNSVHNYDVMTYTINE